MLIVHTIFILLHSEQYNEIDINIFVPKLVESMNVEPADMEGQVYNTTFLCVTKNIHKRCLG